jgi:hypothetical protein
MPIPLLFLLLILSLPRRESTVVVQLAGSGNHQGKINFNLAIFVWKMMKGFHHLAHPL